VEPETGRVHTDFNQAVTATGRLSSSNPNLQNIPVRTEFSRRIRKAFLPQEGWTLLSADYSQIELRILTHLSGEAVLVEAYRNGDDVHALTARLLLDKAELSAEERRLGKTINFGVIYGMGAQRFAREAGVSQAEARDFLRRYRQRYPQVFAFLELQERLALSRGYVETILGRRRRFDFDPSSLPRPLGAGPPRPGGAAVARGRQCSDPGFQRRHHQAGDGAAAPSSAGGCSAGPAAAAGA
jgi:DNA polymerase-1